MKKIYLLLAMLAGGGMAQAQTCGTTISAFPHTQDFETSTAGAPGTLPTGWTTSPTSGYRWEIQDGPTTSSNTGPSVDHSTGVAGGKYPYTEASSGSTGDISTLTSPCFNIATLTTPGFDFWYHMYGAAMGSLEVQVSTNNGTTWTPLFSITGEQQTSTTDAWIKKTISLAGYTGTIQIRFQGTRGTSFTSDIAIDDFKIYNIPPNDAGVVAVNTPTSPVQPGISTPVSVTIKNFGGSNLTSATIGYSIDGTTMVNNYSFTGNLTGNQTSAALTLGNATFTAGAHTLKAWTTSPNGATDGDLSNDTTTVELIACTSLSGTYTIDQNSPASATNFQSVALAAQALNSCGISGPVTFNVAANSGPYADPVVLTAISGASATNTITFNGNGNTIMTTPAGNYSGIISLDDADYVKFDNFILTLDNGATAGFGVQLMNQADHITISNTTINLPLTTTSSSVSGIIAGTTVSSAGDHTNHSKFENNTINGGYYSIRLNGPSGTTGATGNQILNNTIKDGYAYNIYLYNQENALVEGNDVSRPTRSTVTSFYGVYISGSSKSNVINANRFHNSHGGAASLTGAAYVIYLSGTDAPVGSENIIKNNLIYDINTNGTVYSLYNSGSNGAWYLHNTIDLSNPTSTGTVRGLYQTGTATNIKLQNNIITITDGTSGTKTGLYFSTTTSSILSDNNVLFVPVGDVGYRSGAKTTLADWRTASSQDANSVSANPLYVDVTTGLLRPTNSLINNIGAPVGVTTDIMGLTRSSTTPDPGAYEFTPAANDAGVTAIITPTTPVTPGVSQPVQVTIKNFGLSALTSATIAWTVDGTAQTPFSWTGNLANNATANVTIGNYTFPAGNFDLEVCATLPNGSTDANPGNNCTLENITSCMALAGSYTIDKNSPASATNFQSLTDAANRVNSCGISAAVTFNVVANSGPYNEQLILTQISGTSATNTITFEGNGNTILTAPTGTANGIVTFDGADYVKVNNFTITLDPTATSGWGVQLMNQADHNIISNNTINLPLTVTSSAVSGIISGSAIATAGVNTSNTIIENNTINGGYYSIRLNGDTGTQDALDNQIIGNTLKDFYAYGIYLDDTEGTLVEENDVSRPTRSTITSFYGVYMLGTNQNVTIAKNRFHNGFGGDPTPTGAAYVIYSSSSDAPIGSENIIKNNLIYDINTTGTIYAIYNLGSDGAWYFNNTIDLSNAASTGTVRGVYQTTTATNIKFQNNIISIMAATSGTKTGLYFNATASGITSDNNVLYVPVGNVGYYGGVKTTLADWKLANSGAFDQASISADPQYVDYATGNLRPTNVALDNIGTPIAGVVQDITGATRNATTPDPGAYSFTVNPNDVGITAVTGAASGCGLTNAQSITIIVKNFGSAPQSNIPVNFMVNGAVIGTGTIAGPLAPNDTTSFTFTTTANLSAPGPYAIVANTLLTGDSDPANNTFNLNVTNSLIPTLPVALDFEAPATGIGAVQVVTNAKSTITEDAGAAFTGSKGMIMAGITSSNWVMPVGVVDPWTSNGDQFSAVYMCISPAGGAATDSLILSFDLKQLFKTAAANTNFRVTVNGQQIGTTYNPPFSGSPIAWEHIRIDLTPYMNLSNVQIGLESSVKEEYAGGNGTANLIDNVMIVRKTVSGTKSDILAGKISVYPNPSNGMFQVTAPQGNYTLEVTDMTGRTVLKQTATGTETQVNLQDTAKGIYLLKITSEGNMAVKRLVVE